jgi:hypothetical protein
MTAIIRSALSVLLVVSVAGMNGCAATGTTTDGNADGAARDDCLFAVTLRDWRPLDDRNLLLFGTGRRAHHVELVRPASGLRFDVMLGVYDRDGMICPYGGDAIVIGGPMPDRIAIRSIERLSDDELDAVYVRFGIRAPAVIDATEVESEEAEDSQRGDTR